MPDALPIPLLMSWSIFGLALYFVRQHTSVLRASSPDDGSTWYELLFPVSVIVGTPVGLVLLYLYVSAVGWFWTLVLCVSMFLVCAVIGVVLVTLVEQRLLGKIGLVVWPFAAAATYLVIADLPR